MPDGQEEKKLSHLSTVMCHNRLKHSLYGGGKKEEWKPVKTCFFLLRQTFLFFKKFLNVERKDICAAETMKSEEHSVTRLLAALPLPSSTPRFALSLSHFGSPLVLSLLANTEIHLHLVTSSLLYAR